MSGKFTVLIGGFTPRRSNTLFGFVDVVVPEMRLQIKEVSIHERSSRRWIGLPARPQLDPEGRVRLDDRGKRLYSAVLAFIDKPTATAFSDRIIEALLNIHPHAFDDVEESAEAK
jgi:hypothetical protein